MSTSDDSYPGPLHLERTAIRGYQYFFYTKHHNPHNKNASQWLPEVSQDDEFQIFNLADLHQIEGANGDLFGLRRGPENEILALGTAKQQVAEFPRAHAGQAWHGYPLWPIRRQETDGPPRQPAPREALRKMEAVGWITANQRRWLEAGKLIS